MNRAGRWIAALGLVVAVALYVVEGVGPVARMLAAAGGGLLVAAAFHVVPMLVNAWAWQALIPSSTRRDFPTVAMALWIRESVNGLLPVARIGGEIAAYRFLLHSPLPRAPVVASLVVDLTLSLLSQALFCVVGVVLLLGAGMPGSPAVAFAGTAAVLIVLGVAVVGLQGSSVPGSLLRRLDIVLAGRFADALERTARVDREIRVLYRRRRRIAACLALQSVGWVAGAGEIWLALAFLGRPVDVAHAILIEAVIQMIGSVAFVVPGALGVQETGFVAIGAVLGIDGPTALALAAARRVRDLAVFFPGLLAWQHAEGRVARAGGHDVEHRSRGEPAPDRRKAASRRRCR